MRLENEKLVLRDMQINDIEDVVNWNTIETEWMNWDAPWEHEDKDEFDWDAYRINKRNEILQREENTQLRARLEVCLQDEQEAHIGSVSCYFIDEAYRINDQGSKIAIGMSLPNTKYRGKGLGKASFLMYIQYLKSLGYQEIYTQTWSGNIPMIKMAESIGFVECNRYEGIRKVKGKPFDGLTFVYR